VLAGAVEPAPQLAPRAPDLRAATAMLLVLVAFVMAGSGIIAPILPIYGELFSSSATLVGMLITIFGITRFVANFPSGLAFEKIGPRALLISGSAVLLLGGVGAALASDLVSLLIWRGVQGLGSGIFLTTVGVLVGKISRPETRGRFLANYQTAVFIGAGVGPALGGYIAQWFGITAPFWAYALVALAALIVSLFFSLGATAGQDASTAVGPPVRLGAVLRQPEFLANVAMSFALGFLRTAALWQLIPLIASGRFSMSFDLIGIAITVTSFSTLLVLPVSGRLIDRYGSRFLPAIAALGLAGSLVLVALGPTQFWFWAGISLTGIASGLIGPALATALVDMTPSHLLGGATGFQRMIGDAGFVAGPVVVGALADLAILDDAGGLVLTGGLIAASGIFWILVYTRRKAMEP
jgi:MFS family permease